MEKSDTSTAAKVVSFISISFILVSTIGMTLNTIPGIYKVDEKGTQTGKYLVGTGTPTTMPWTPHY